MSAIKIFLVILWLSIFPYIIGKVLTLKKDKVNDEFMYSWLFGNVYQMALYFLLAIPFILKRKSFLLLTNTFAIAVIFSVIISLIILIINRKKFFKKIEFKNIKKVNFYQIIAILIIIAQLFVKVKYTNINNDDSSFVVLSKQMIQTDKMYVESENKLNARRALAPISAYYASLSKLTKIDSTILIHSVMPLILIVMYYTVYYYFSKKIFKKSEDSWIMLIFLSVISLYGFNAKGVNKYMLLYSWFGRAILAGIILPLIWKVSLEAMNKDGKIIDWIRFFIVILSAGLGSEMATPLVGISVGCLTLKSCIEDKKISYIPKALICLIPVLMVGIIYIKIK